jgi:hypothetical protein
MSVHVAPRQTGPEEHCSTFAPRMKDLSELSRLARSLAEGLADLSVQSDDSIPEESDAEDISVSPPNLGVGAVRINIYADDPFSEATPTPNPQNDAVIAVSQPNNAHSTLQFNVLGTSPAPQRYSPGTAEFRHWLAVEALSRGVNFWASLMPPGTTWSTFSHPMQVNLVAGMDLNANYSRAFGLRFYQEMVRGIPVFSGESADVVCHELGHAIIDALRPQLFNAASLEADAAHEGASDVSAMLCALQLQQFRDRVLSETGGRLNVNSRLSRMAEQLGWAIRQNWPASVDQDSLRNSANSFFYRPPSQLPPSAPANQLSSESHSFGRVLSAAFLDALAGMYNALGAGGSPQLEQASQDLGQLFADGFRTCRIVSAFYSSLASAVILADRTRFGGRYQASLTSAFVRRGILSLPAIEAIGSSPTPRFVPIAMQTATLQGFATGATRPMLEGDDSYLRPGLQAPDLPTRAVPTPLGIRLMVHVPEDDDTLPARAASVVGGSLSPVDVRDDASAFVAHLVQQGRLDMREASVEMAQRGALASLSPQPSRRDSRITHMLTKHESGQLVLKRRHFDCAGHCRRVSR